MELTPNFILQIAAMIFYFVGMCIGIICYYKYMIKVTDPGQFKTPDDKTYRLAYLIFLISVIVFLSLGLGKQMNNNIIAVLGTIAGYVLGSEVRRSHEEDRK